jgi:hypothetical protein
MVRLKHESASAKQCPQVSELQCSRTEETFFTATTSVLAGFPHTFYGSRSRYGTKLVSLSVHVCTKLALLTLVSAIQGGWHGKG